MSNNIGKIINIEISNRAQRQIKKLNPEAKKAYLKVKNKIENGDFTGLNDHPLTGPRKGQRAADIIVPGAGTGRGKYRLVYERKGKNSILVIEILKQHNY